MADDALSQILNILKLRGAIYFHTHFSPPWGVQVPAFRNVARFHMAMRGECWLKVEGVEEPVHLSTGDLIVIPHGAAHVLSDERDREAIMVDDVVHRAGYTGQGALTYGGDQDGGVCKLFCGHFEFEEGVMHPLLNDLPRYIHIPNTQTMNAYWLESVMRFVSAEVMSDAAGAEAIVHRLTEIIFIQVIRAFVEKNGDQAGTLAALLNPKFSRCLARVHQAPESNWTVETMAAEAGMSRTVFAEKFTALIGMTPLSYVTHWRMQLARRDLLESDLPLIDIAEQVGYASEAAFNRAFKRHFEMTPGEMRRVRH
ncbi:AraC family transcriptional regulator [Kiloniella sp. b19]|uniref:AraC family transcriptional regulator n=1 Tax=Kiloniella sp. GXU_MW_B19 TaxID=3141326 RepID=UPI0031D14E8E